MGGGEFGAARGNSAGTHSGIDFLAPVGTSLLAVCDASEAVVGSDPNGYGNYVILACPLPATLTAGRTLWASIMYAHLSTVAIADGSNVAKGQRLGAVGKTGNAAGAGVNPHVHWEVTVHSSKQAALADGHRSSDNTGNNAATLFEVSFRAGCLTPNTVKPRTGPVMRGRRPDPYLLLVCSVRAKPALKTPPTSAQSFLEAWSNHFSAVGFDINVGR